MNSYGRVTVFVSVLTLMSGWLVFSQAPPAPAPVPETPKTLKLPAPKLDGGLSVEKTLQARRSCRTLSEKALSLQELGQLCWAAQGTTDDKGHRTAPSAMATYPLEVYVFASRVESLPAGLYRYLSKEHSLTLVKAGLSSKDFVDQAVKQDWVKQAPAVLVITAIAERVARKGTPKGDRYAWVEAGLAAENFFLQAVSLGMGSTYVGGFDDDGVKRFMSLPAGETPMAVLPVGWKQ